MSLSEETYNNEIRQRITSENIIDKYKYFLTYKSINNLKEFLTCIDNNEVYKPNLSKFLCIVGRNVDTETLVEDIESIGCEFNYIEELKTYKKDSINGILYAKYSPSLDDIIKQCVSDDQYMFKDGLGDFRQTSTIITSKTKMNDPSMNHRAVYVEFI